VCSCYPSSFAPFGLAPPLGVRGFRIGAVAGMLAPSTSIFVSLVFVSAPQYAHSEAGAEAVAIRQARADRMQRCVRVRTRTRPARARRASLLDYMEAFYNRQRRHSTLSYEAPLAFEATQIA
jgi:hypothetical protein